MPCEFGVDIGGITVCFDGIVDGILGALNQYVVYPLISSFNEYIVQPVANFFSSLWSDIENGLSNAISTLEGSFSVVGSDLESFFTTVGQDIENSLSAAWTDITTTLGTLGSDIMGSLSGLGSDIENFIMPLTSEIMGGITSLGSWLASGLNAIEIDVGNVVGEIGNTVSSALGSFTSLVNSGLGDLGGYLQKVASALSSGVGEAISDVTSLGGEIENAFSSVGNVVENAFKEFATDAYAALKDVTSMILSGLETLGNSVLSFGRDVINQLLALIKPRGKNDVVNVISEVEDAALLGSAAYIGITGAVKVLENIHPFHELNIQQYTDKIMGMFAVDVIPSKFIEGVFTMGLFTQMQYALNFMMRPRLTDRMIEERSVWYGLESPSEFAQSLALEGMTDDLVSKAVGVLYRPMSPFILRYMMETGLVTDSFLAKQLAMEGFSPEDAAETAKVFDALMLAPFQNQIKSVIYTYHKSGLMSDATATQIMNVFQIPKVQQEWILQTAKLDFQLEQKQMLGQVALDLIEKGELSVQDAIKTLVSIGYQEDRAKVLATIRAITTGPPPPKSSRAMILQSALSELSALGLGA